MNLNETSAQKKRETTVSPFGSEDNQGPASTAQVRPLCVAPPQSTYLYGPGGKYKGKFGYATTIVEATKDWDTSPVAIRMNLTRTIILRPATKLPNFAM